MVKAGGDDEDSYSVGYGKPPKEGQFKKGRSGNPRGRPPKARSLVLAQDPIAEMILKEAARLIPVKQDGQTIQMPTSQVLARSILLNGAKGTMRQQKLAYELIQNAEAAARKTTQEHFDTYQMYQETWPSRFEEALRRGDPEPNKLPHPSQLHLKLESNRLDIRGPVHPEGKVWWERHKIALRWIEAEIRNASDAHGHDYSKEHTNERLRLLSQFQKRLLKQVPPGWNWREELGWEADWEEAFYKGYALTFPLKDPAKARLTANRTDLSP